MTKTYSTKVSMTDEKAQTIVDQLNTKLGADGHAYVSRSFGVGDPYIIAIVPDTFDINTYIPGAQTVTPEDAGLDTVQERDEDEKGVTD